MRLLMINLLATAVVLLGATSASAFSLFISDVLQPTGTAVTSDQVIIEISLDADGAGIEGFSLGLVYDADIFEYVQGASAATTYILFSPNEGKGKPSVYLVPSPTPPNQWPGTVAPGTEQVNVDFVEPTFGATRATGNGIFLATIVFHIEGAGDGLGEINLSLTSGGNLFRVNGSDIGGSVTLGPGVSVVTPEPTTAILVGLGLVGLGVAGRRRS